MQKNKKEAGFTLVELVAVVVILGLIALVAVPAVAGVIRDSKKNVKDVNIDTVLNAANDYALKFPTILPDSTHTESEMICAEELINCGFLKSDIGVKEVEGIQKSSFKIYYCSKKGTQPCVSEPKYGKYFGNYLITYIENSNQTCNADNYRCKPVDAKS